MDKILVDPEKALRNAANHVRFGYAWFYSDRAVTIPTEEFLLYLADDVRLDSFRWQAIMARS